MKDHFSIGSGDYSRYRPTYPDAFYKFLNSVTTHTENAWDCGTGNGQMAVRLAEYFENVFATDISESQLQQAHEVKGVHYSVQPAERTDFPDRFFDLIIAAQAAHWFDLESFYSEVRRTGRDNAVLVIMGYTLPRISAELDKVVDWFYNEIVGDYWDFERKYIDEGYLTMPFPFDEIKAPRMESRFDWTRTHLMGYLGTWSAVKQYIKVNGATPMNYISDAIVRCWDGNASKTVTFPLLIRMGMVSK